MPVIMAARHFSPVTYMELYSSIQVDGTSNAAFGLSAGL